MAGLSGFWRITFMYKQKIIIPTFLSNENQRRHGFSTLKNGFSNRWPLRPAVGYFFESNTTRFRQTVGLARQLVKISVLRKTCGRRLWLSTCRPATWRKSQAKADCSFWTTITQNVEKICGKPKISENLCQRIKQNCPQAMKKADRVGCQYLLVQIVIDGFGSLCSPVFLVEEWPLGTKKHHKNRDPSQFSAPR